MFKVTEYKRKPRIAIPPISIFGKEYSTSTNKQLSKRFVVCRSTIEKWARHYGLYKRIPNKDTMRLTNYQKQIVVGCLLGDGHLAKPKKQTHNSYFCINHSCKQLDYCKWKFNALRPCSMRYKISVTPGRTRLNNGLIIPNKNQKLYKVSFGTISNQYFTAMRASWYNNEGRKIVPPNVNISNLTLAVWFFDDGTNDYKNRYVRLCTHSFTDTERESLVLLLRRKGWACRAYRESIQIGPTSYVKFLQLMKTYLPTLDMKYKVDLSRYKPPKYLKRYWRQFDGPTKKADTTRH